MALIILGKTKCRICGKAMEEGQDLVAFTAFVGNMRDPLFRFSDSAFHAECFRRDPLAAAAERRYQEVRKRLGPGARQCAVCGQPITTPDDYLTLGHITPDEADALYRYNYAQFHRSCLRSWPDLVPVLAELRRLRRSGGWEGPFLDWLIDTLSALLPRESTDTRSGTAGSAI